MHPARDKRSGTLSGFDFRRVDEPREIERDAAQMAQWIFDSGSQFFTVLFGSRARAIENLQNWVERESSEFSARQATLAYAHGDPAGMIIGVCGDEIPQRRRADLLALIQQTAAADRIALKAKLENIAELTAPVSAGDYYVRTLAVDAAQRGRGLGRELLKQAMQEARGLGFERVRLDVDSDNAVARALYASAGFSSIYEGRVDALRLHMHSLALTF